MDRIHRLMWYLPAMAIAFIATACINVTTTPQVVEKPVNHAPTARALFPQVGYYVDEQIVFDASSSEDPDGGDTMQYAWNFGDNSAVAAGVTVTHSFATEGSFTVRLTVTDKGGLNSFDEKNVLIQSKVGNAPLVVPDQSVVSGKTGTPITLSGQVTASSAGETCTASWDFGDGTAAATGLSVTHSYAAGGVYVATLTGTDAGDGLKAYGQVAVRINTDPLASFTISTSSPARGESITCDGSSSYDPDGSALTYAWKLDGASAGTASTLVKSFAASGTHSIALTVTDPQGSTATLSKTITVVNGLPTVAIDVLATADMNKGVGSGFTLTASVDDPEKAKLSYSWTVTGPAGVTPKSGTISAGTGGIYSSLSFSFVAGAAGEYSVTLSVTDDESASAYDSSSVVAANLSTHDLDPPKPIFAPPPVDPDLLQAIADATGPGKNLIPASRATVQKIYGIVSRPIPFDLQKSCDPGGLQTGIDAGAKLTAAWDFGDLSTASTTALLQSHAYATTGNFSVHVVVTDDEGSTNDIYIPVQILGPANKAPVAKAGGTVTTQILDGQTTATAHLNGTASYDPDQGQVLSYAWTMADGSAIQGVSITNTAGLDLSFTSPGVRQYKLTVTDSGNPPKSASEIATVVVTKQILNHAPIVNLPGDRTVIKGEPLAFASALSADPDGDALSFKWEAAASGQAPFQTGIKSEFLVSFPAAGSYTVKLTATDNGTPVMATSASANITVIEPPVVGYKIALSEGSDLKLPLDSRTPVTIGIYEKGGTGWEASAPLAKVVAAGPGNFILRIDGFPADKPYSDAKSYVLLASHGASGVPSFWGVYKSGSAGNLSYSLGDTSVLGKAADAATYAITFVDGNSAKLEVTAW